MSTIGNTANCPFRMNRKGINSSGATVARLRPDVLVWLPSDVLAFKGEDKATVSKIVMARHDIKRHQYTPYR
eukprot:scaffold4643_cov76-Amphora_coffeaeformis.AAC.1